MSLPFEWVPIDPFLPDDVLTGVEIVFSPELERAIIVIATNSYYSDDGINWQFGGFVHTHAQAQTIWNASQSKFYCIVSPSNHLCYSSVDGITWVEEGEVVGSSSHTWTSFVTNSLGTMYLLDREGNVYISNSGGTSWTNAGNDLPGVEIGVTIFWAFLTIHTSGLLVVFNIGAPINIPFATSPDGVTWTGRHGFEVLFTSNNDVNAVAVKPTGLICAITEISAFIMTSSDGISWTKDGNQLPDWGADGPEQITTPMLWSENEGVFVAASNNLVPGETRVFTSPDAVTWTVDAGVVPAVEKVFDPPNTIAEFGGLAEAPEWERFWMSITSSASETPVITSPPYDNSEITGDQELEIEDASLLSIGSGEILGDLELEVMLTEAYEIIGDLTLEIELIPRTVWSSDASGLYILVRNKTNDTIYDREGSEDTVDVNIPDPILGTAYVGG